MSDVLLLSRYERLGASSRMRSYQFLPALAAAGIDVAVRPMLDDAYLRARHAGRRPAGNVALAYVRRVRDVLANRDAPLVWIEYEALPWLPYALERALLAGGRPFIVDYDDAIFHRYGMHTSALVRGALGGKIDRLMRASACVIAGNDYLARRAREAGASRVETLPTVIDLERYRARTDHATQGPLVVGWIGSPSTTGYLRSVESPLRRLAERRPLRVVNVGGAPWRSAFFEVENRPWSEASEVEEMLRFDVGIMPLDDTPWSRGKCGFKLIQYMGCALPTVASPVGANVDIVEHGVTGFHAANDDQWVEALDSLARDTGLRRAMGLAGRERVRRHYSLAAVAPRLVALVSELLAQARAGRR
jgi:glycosyltransferase involved in cell wall biosynthesis